MNKKIIEKLLKKPPSDPDKAYIFVNDNRAICEAVITVGHMALYLAGDGDGFFTAESFCTFVRDTVNTGTEIMAYTFVLACYRKRTNDALERVLKDNLIPYKAGAYTLFKDKEYLAKYEKQEELERRLKAYVARFEGPGDETEDIDRKRFCVFAENGAVRGILDIAIVQYIKETCCMFVTGRELYLYQDGCYRPDEDGIRIKGRIAKLIPERFVTYRNLSSVYSLLLEQPDLQKTMEELNAYPPWWINFRNGMFDVREMKLKKHRPEYLSINQIPHVLDLAVRDRLEESGAVTRRFLESALPDPDDRVTLWQFLGYCMTRDTRFQKFLIIQGDGGTGKSKVIGLAQELVGLSNSSAVSLQELNERFFPSLLYGKLLNACADIRSDALMAVDNIKKATGEDVMLCEKKNKDPKPFRSYAKLIFSANKIPLNLDEKSSAFYRRLLILKINRKPSKEEKDLELGEKLAGEIGYSIWMAVGALWKLYQDGEFTESAGCRERIEELYREADTVKAFADECLESQAGSRVARKLMYEQYVEYCKSYGRRFHSPNVFYRNLAEKGFTEGRNAKERYYKDVTLKDEGFLPIEDP